MLITRGIYLVDVLDRLLIAHPTNAHYWSIPKGLTEPGESFTQTAYREFKEETDIDLDFVKKDEFHQLPSVVYTNKSKTLESAFIRISHTIPIEQMICTSMVEADVPFPENDDFRWVSLEEARELLFTQQVENLDIIQEILDNRLINEG